MKVLVCTSEYPPGGGGIANVVQSCVTRLQAKGISCTVCSPTGPDIQLGSKRLIRKLGRLGLLYYWYQVASHLGDGRDYDLVWLHQPLFLVRNPFPRALATMHVNAASVSRQLTAASNYPVYLKLYKQAAALIETLCLKRLMTGEVSFSADSLQVYNDLRAIGVDKVDYIPNGVDIDIFKPTHTKNTLRQKYDLPLNSRILLSVGRISKIKNQEKLIDVYSFIEKRTEDVFLVLVGGGEFTAKLEERARKEGIRRIRFLGYIDYSQIHEIYAFSDLYLMSSIYEGQPLALLEAMASGLPCIVSPAPGISTVVKEAQAGIVVDFFDDAAAAQHIIGFLQDNLSSYGNNARRYACENFNWEHVVNRYIGKFNEICSAGGAKCQSV